MSRIVIKLSYRDPNLTLIEVGNKSLDLGLIKKNIGESDGKALLECVYKCWANMPEIVIMCDDSGMLKQLPIVIVTIRGEIAGDILIGEINRNEDGEQDIYGMSTDKAARVLKALFPHGMNQVNIGAWN